MDSFDLLKIAVLPLVVLLFWYLYLRHWHIGHGMVLSFKESDGTVWVASRLLDSVAWQQGVRMRTRVLSIDGERMQFLNGQEFLSWFKTHKPKRGQGEIWIFEEGLIVELIPRLITTQIPVHWSPNEKIKEEPLEKDYRIQEAVHPCPKTGEYYITRRISKEAIREEYFRM